jgi:hypothetical protein
MRGAGTSIPSKKKRKTPINLSRVECGVVLFRTLYNFIERESNRRESGHPHTRHPAELDGKVVGDDQFCFRVPLLDNVTLGRDCCMPCRSSCNLAGVECT